MDEDAARKHGAKLTAIAILAGFLVLGAIFVVEIRDAQIGIWQSALSASDKYLWFGRLQTTKSLTALVAILVGLMGASYAWRAGQKPE